VKRLFLLTAFLFAEIPCRAQIALVKSTAMPSAVLATGGKVTTAAVSMIGATSIWCGITYGRSANTFTVSDSKSNAWHSTAAAISRSGMGVQWFYTYGPTTSSSQTFTLTSTGSTTRGAIGCYGLSGTLTTSGVLDPSSPAGSVSASSSGTTIQPGSLTPAVSGEAFVTVVGNNNIGDTYSISSPFNTPVSDGANWNGAISYYISTGTSAEDPTWTISSHDFLAASMVAVEPAGQPSGGNCPASVPVPPITSCSYSANFGSQTVGSTSSVQTLSFSIAAGTVVGSISVLTTGIAGKDFANATGSTCTASTFSTATNCVVNVTLTPLVAGPRRGAVVFYSGANNTGTVLVTVPVYGVGNAPQVAYGPGGAQTNVGSGFSSPQAVAVDGAGNVFIADATAAMVDKVTPAGTQTTVGSGFGKPEGVAVDGAGNVYVTDFNAAAVYQVAPGGTQTTVGRGFIEPAGVAVDGAGNVYVVDPGAPAVYKVTPGGTQTMVGSGFIEPAGVAVDGAGNVYVVDPGVPAVYKVTPGGTQTTASSGFSKPEGVAVDAAGSVYIVDAGTNALYEVTPSGTQTVASGFNNPAGLAVDGSGNLYVGDTGHIRVVKIDRADAPSLSFATTNVGSTSTDSPKTAEVQNIGNLALTLTGLSYPVDFPEATSDTGACTGTTSLIPAEQCDLPIDFTPQSQASLSEDVTLSDNALNVTGAAQSIAVSGTGSSGLATQTIIFTRPASPITYGVSPIMFSATGGASGNPVIFTIVSGPGSITGSTLTITGVGTVVVAANQAGNASYAAAVQVTQSVVVNQASQTITFTPPTSPAVFGVSPITLNATGGASGNPVTFTNVSGPGSINGSTLTITGAGTVVVAANQAGNANYAAAAQVTQSITVTQAPQTITFTPPTSPVTYVSTAQSQPVFTLLQKCHATSNTTNTCTFGKNVTPGDLVVGGAVIDNTIASTGVKDGAGNVFTLSPNSPCTGGSVTSHGWLFYLLSSPGGANTNMVVFSDTNADYVDEIWAYEFSVFGGTPAFDTDINGCGMSTSSTNPAATLILSGANELAYFVGYLVGGKTTGVGSPWTLGTLGTSGGVDGFDPTASSSITTAVTPAGDGWGILMAMAIKLVPVGSITLSATGGASGNPVIFTVVSGPGSITGSALTITGVGTLVVAANQAGNVNFTAAAPVTQSIIVNQASQIISFTPPSPVMYGVSPITLSATGGASGNPVIFAVVSGPGSITGSTLTITGAGTVVVAANQAGNADYTAAAQVTQSIVVNQASQTISFIPPSPVTYGVSPITLSATGGASGNPVTFIVVSGPGSITGTTLTITGASTVVVAANQAGNANYAAAAQVILSIVVNQASQTISFTPPTSPIVFGVPPITLNATGGPSGNPVIFTVVSGPGSITAGTLTITGVGTVVVAANQVGNANYAAAVQVTQSIVVTANMAIPNLVVTTANDDAGAASNCTPQTSPGTGTDASCSLRDALSYASIAGAGNVSFSSAAFAVANPAAQNTITLSNGTLNMPPNTTVAGSGSGLASQVTVSGANGYTVFSVGSGVPGIRLTGLTIANGNSALGGGIYNQGTLVVIASTLSGNSTNSNGGGINNQGMLTVSDSTISGNTATGNGGGIYNQGTLTVSDSTVSGNTATGKGGGIENAGGTASLANTIVSGNSAPTGVDFDGSAYTDNAGNQVGASGIGLAPLANYGGPTQTLLPLSGSPAVCAGTAANAIGLTIDQRGLARSTTYGSTPCVDSGAVQTNYTLAFSIEPPSIANAGQAISPGPVVQLTESGAVATAAGSSVSISGSPVTLSGTTSANLSSGLAAFSNLVVPSATSNETLTATLALNPSLTLSLTAASSSVSALSTQTITFTPPTSPVVFGVSPITLNATGGASGNPVIFTVVSGPGSIAGRTLSITGIGTVAVAANQAGNASYAAAAQVAQSVVVNQASQTITFTPPTSPVVFGVPPITLNATGGASGNPVTFAVVSGPGSITGSTLTITGVGTVVVAANQAGNANYTAAAQVTESVTVSQASNVMTTVVQHAFAGDASGCNEHLTCTLSTAVGVTKLSQAIGSGHLLLLTIVGEGTSNFPVPGTPSCNSSGCGTWVHLSGGNNGTSYCANQYLIETGHHFFTDCWAIYSTTSGSTSFTVPFEDSGGASDITNMDLFLIELSCSGSCTHNTLDVQASVQLASGNCSSCTGPSLTLSGSNDVVMQVACFQENYARIGSPYTLEDVDTNSANAIAYRLDTNSGNAATWGQSPTGGGIFSAYAISIAP
jgi:hypothetical protein